MALEPDDLQRMKEVVENATMPIRVQLDSTGKVLEETRNDMKDYITRATDQWDKHWDHHEKERERCAAIQKDMDLRVDAVDTKATKAKEEASTAKTWSSWIMRLLIGAGGTGGAYGLIKAALGMKGGQ